jgi:fructokinase
MQKIIMSFGELLWDILPDCTKLGGAPFNFTYRADSLGDHGLMVSRLGDDELGRQAFEQVQALKMDTSFLQWHQQKPTGTVQVSFDADNNPDYVIIPEVAYDYIEITGALLESAAKADCLCFGSLAQRATTSRQTLAELIEAADAGVKLLDINLRKDCYNIDTVKYSLAKGDILKLNEDEAHALGDMLTLPHDTLPAFCKAVSEAWSLQYCLVTLAEKGVYACAGSREDIYIPGHKVELADSLGSGDAFTAGFIHKLLRAAPFTEACEHGNILGAIVATQTGPTGAISDEDIEKFKASQFERNIHPDFFDFV